MDGLPQGGPSDLLTGEGPVHSNLVKLSRWMAGAGGVVLAALILLICVSVLGRGINTMMHGSLFQGSLNGFAELVLSTGIGPILGDFELVEAGIAFSIFAFIPFCQITQSHATVDILTTAFSERVNRFLMWAAEVLFFIVLALIAWRLWDGMLAKKSYGETTFLIQFQVWYGYAVCIPPAVLAVIVSAYLAVMRSVEISTGRAVLPRTQGAVH